MNIRVVYRVHINVSIAAATNLLCLEHYRFGRNIIHLLQH